MRKIDRFMQLNASYFLMAALIPTFIFFRVVKLLEVKTVQAQQLQTQTTELITDNEALKDQLAVSSKIQTSEEVKTISRYYIHKYFPESSWTKVEKIMTCESNLNPLATNWKNSNKTVDRGLYMINSVHKAQFKAVTGIDYEVGAYSWDASSKFAKWLYDNQGLNPWVCSKLV